MANYIMPPANSGDTYEGASFTMSKNGSPMDLTSASIIMNVNANGTNVQFSTNNEKLRITDAINGVFEFRKQVVDFWSFGTFPYEIIFQFTNGDIKTYITGTWTVSRG